MMIEGEMFVKLRGSDQTLGRALASAAGLHDQVKGLRPSIGGCPGYNTLVQMRNKQQSVDVAKPVVSSVLQSLFARSSQLAEGVASSDTSDTPAKRRRSTREVLELRDNMKSFRMRLNDTITVIVARPICNDDDLCVKCDAANVAAVLSFINDAGLTKDNFLSRRSYAVSGHKGVWKFGHQFYRKGDEVNTGDRKSTLLEVTQATADEHEQNGCDNSPESEHDANVASDDGSDQSCA